MKKAPDMGKNRNNTMVNTCSHDKEIMVSLALLRLS
jgi:hypothetical protein